ncbi:Fic family protein [Candidatus Uhrbacteria bacterium]|nr:Fic family protein [Candidatus Uhrbacteria bacterium]
MDIAQKIKKLKKKIDSLRPLTPSELRELHKWYAVTYTYHSNALEGNTLSLGETKLVVEDGITVGGHPLREILEAKNHKEVIEELISIIQKKKSITEQLIKKLHKTLIKEIDNETAGRYRKIQVYITGEEVLPPPARRVPLLMKEFWAWFAKQKKTDPVVLAAKAHYRFVKIHPFTDGNGRIARVLSNIILMRAGYPLVIIPVVVRQKYLTALHSSRTEMDFVTFFQEITLENMKDYLRMIGHSAK